MNGDRHEFRSSRAQVQHGILLGAVLAVIGLGSLFFGGSSVPDAELVGAVVLVLAAGVLIVVVRGARDTRPRMVLDRDGVWFRDWGIEKVSWAAIDAVYTSGSRLQAFITLSLRDPEGFLNALPPAERVRLTSSHLFRRPELRIPHNALDAPLDEVLAALRSGLED
jgi:hypothetical protein